MNTPKALVSSPALRLFPFIFVFLVVMPSFAQTCLTADDMDAANKSALTNTAKSFFDMAGRGDSGSLRQNSILSLAADFSNVETAVSDHKADFAGAQATPRPPFLLRAEGSAPVERAEFLCGVFGANGQTAGSSEFVIPNLPPGEYGIVILDVPTAKQPYTVSFVLQHDRTAWKLGGFFVKETQTNGHDGNWFAGQARAFKAKGQNHNAWLYFLHAQDLLSPLPFMSTLRTDKLYDESQGAKPADMPSSGATVDLAASGKTYKLTALFPLLVAKDLDLVVKYGAPNVSDTTKTFQDNMAVMKALITKFPELRDAFDGVVARAVEPSGRDYGTLMSMKEIKTANAGAATQANRNAEANNPSSHQNATQPSSFTVNTIPTRPPLSLAALPSSPEVAGSLWHCSYVLNMPEGPDRRDFFLILSPSHKWGKFVSQSNATVDDADGYYLSKWTLNGAQLVVSDTEFTFNGTVSSNSFSGSVTWVRFSGHFDCTFLRNESSLQKMDKDQARRRWKLSNRYRTELDFEVRADHPSATGNDCGSNEILWQQTLKSGESYTQSCSSNEGLCVRWKGAGDSDYGDWTGLSCSGNNPIWTKANNLREWKFGAP